MPVPPVSLYDDKADLKSLMQETIAGFALGAGTSSRVRPSLPFSGSSPPLFRES